MEHLEGGDASTGLALAETLLKQFPAYAFSGKAYRVLISLEEIESVKLQIGDSFMASPEGVEQFLEDNGYHNYEDSKAVVVVAEIMGFNLEAFLREEMDKFPKGDHEDLESYLHEKEIVATEIIKKIEEYEYKE